jgi:GNAT superfamily N-acetyltransferase
LVPISIELTTAAVADARAIAALRIRVAERLTERHGAGHWSNAGTMASVEYALKRGGLFVVRRDGSIIATLILTTRKPWAIDPQYFTPTRHPLYLTSMAVEPALQRSGIGRNCLDEALRLASIRGVEFIRLDAYDAAAGAGGFYAECGYREVRRVTCRKTPLIYFERAVPLP